MKSLLQCHQTSGIFLFLSPEFPWFIGLGVYSKLHWLCPGKRQVMLLKNAAAWQRGMGLQRMADNALPNGTCRATT